MEIVLATLPIPAKGDLKGTDQRSSEATTQQSKAPPQGKIVIKKKLTFAKLSSLLFFVFLFFFVFVFVFCFCFVLFFIMCNQVTSLYLICLILKPLLVKVVSISFFL